MGFPWFLNIRFPCVGLFLLSRRLFPSHMGVGKKTSYTRYFSAFSVASTSPFGRSQKKILTLATFEKTCGHREKNMLPAEKKCDFVSCKLIFFLYTPTKQAFLQVLCPVQHVLLLYAHQTVFLYKFSILTTLHTLHLMVILT